MTATLARLRELHEACRQAILRLGAEIARLRKEAQLTRDAALEEAAQLAANACLVPPDGGEPTEAERRVADAAACAIRARKTKTLEELLR